MNHNMIYMYENEYNENQKGLLFVMGFNMLMVIMVLYFDDRTDEIERYKEEIRQLKKKNAMDISDYNDLMYQNDENIEDYNKLVDDYNELYDQHQELEAKNSQDINDYNDLVIRHNNLFDMNEELKMRVELLESRLKRSNND